MEASQRRGNQPSRGGFRLPSLPPTQFVRERYRGGAAASATLRRLSEPLPFIKDQNWHATRRSLNQRQKPIMTRRDGAAGAPRVQNVRRRLLAGMLPA